MSSALVAQLGRVPDNLECCSAPCHDLCERNTFGGLQKHSNTVMGYRVCQLILPISTY